MTPSNPFPPGEQAAAEPVPFRLWWGLAACAGLVGLILAAGPYSVGFNLEPDHGLMWYFWQRSDADAWSRLSAWLPYSLHQLGMWWLIARAKTARPRYVFGLHWFNLWALALNATFILLHIVQTRLFYDGLAQDVHEASSMGSVILMLWMILVMENRRRGLWFGKPAPLMETAGEALRRYHGYYFSWAIIYTFWYHPVELTSGHIAGFAYMFILLLQGSLFFTRFHTNRWWTVSLEVLFVVHGALVAWFIMTRDQPGPMSMFLFGGVALFLVTQMHGLGLTTRGKWLIAAPLIAVMAVFFATFPDTLLGLPRLPLIQYIGACLMAACVTLLVVVGRWLGSRPGAPMPEPPEREHPISSARSPGR